MADDFGLGYALGSDSGGGNNGGGGFGGSFGEGLWAVIILAILFGRGGFGFGGQQGGGGQGGGMTYFGSPCATQADLAAGFNNSAVLNNLNDLKLGQAGIQQTLCQGFNGVNTTMLQGFNGVDNAICTLGYNIQAGINGISREIGDCCCKTERAIDGVNYNMATQFCGLNNTIQTVARDIIDNQNANYRGIMDFMVQEKMASKDARIAALEGQVGRSEQNGVIRAAIDAAVADVLRRTGHDCPSAAYIVQPPTPVNFPTNGCGQVQFGYGGNGCGCGCGC